MLFYVVPTVEKAFKSVICASNFFCKTFEDTKGGNHKS